MYFKREGPKLLQKYYRYSEHARDYVPGSVYAAKLMLLYMTLFCNQNTGLNDLAVVVLHFLIAEGEQTQNTRRLELMLRACCESRGMKPEFHNVYK